MSKLFHMRKLSLELLLSLLLALAVGACVYFPLREGLYAVLDKRLAAPGFYTDSAQRSIHALRRYVEEHGVATSDTKALDAWCNERSGVVLYLWRDGKLLYGTGLSLDMAPDIAPGTAAEADAVQDENTMQISFRDGAATAEFYFYFGEYYYFLLNGMAAMLAFIVIVAVLLLLVRRKTGYIIQIGRELKILEGGDLSYPITVRGRDELAELAQGIDDMRRSIIERDRREQEARGANHALVTAMSHDLRTPLTALIGYLDIIQQGKCSGREQTAHFIQVSRSKAYQIKALSDKLFEYFLVYDTAERPVELEDVDGWELLSQVVEDGLFDLESLGLRVERQGEYPPCRLRVNADLFRRLFGNLFSNIEKYADRETPVTVRYEVRDGCLGVCLCNGIPASTPRVESTEIGLRTCKKIMADLCGRIQLQQSKDLFSARVCFPVRLTDSKAAASETH